MDDVQESVWEIFDSLPKNDESVIKAVGAVVEALEDIVQDFTEGRMTLADVIGE